MGPSSCLACSFVKVLMTMKPYPVWMQVSRMGVVCFHCEDGLTLEAFAHGLTAYRRRVTAASAV